MTTTTFDSLGYFEKLKAAGVPENQAKAHVEVIREVIEDRMVTKRDLKELETATRRDMQEMEARLKTELMAKIAKSRAETIKWTAGLLIAQAAVVATLVKLL